MRTLIRSGTTPAGARWLIRPTSVEDAAAIVLLREQVAVEADRICAAPGAHSAAEEILLLAGLLSQGGMSLTLEVDDLVSGHLVCQRRDAEAGQVAELAIMVAAKIRGAGLGRALIGEAIDWARDAGLNKLVLFVFPENTPAIALYSGIGFVEEGRERRQVVKSGGDRDLLVMGLVL